MYAPIYDGTIIICEYAFFNYSIWGFSLNGYIDHVNFQNINMLNIYYIVTVKLIPINYYVGVLAMLPA